MNLDYIALIENLPMTLLKLLLGQCTWIEGWNDIMLPYHLSNAHETENAPASLIRRKNMPLVVME